MERIFGLDLVKGLEKNLKTTLERAKKRQGLRLKLGVIHDEAAVSRYFVDREARVWQRLGLAAEFHSIKAGGEAALKKAIRKFNSDHTVAGFLLHWPLAGVGRDLFAVTELINPAKDIDGLNPLNRLRPGAAGFQPSFVLALDKVLEHNSVELQGKNICVVGRSDFIGRPLADYFLAKDATVTVCHRATKDLHRHTREAQIVVLAAGRPGLIGAAHVSAGAVIIDMGTTLIEDDGGLKLVGDANAASLEAKAGLLIPMPGGVGPLVPYMIAANALKAANALPANLQYNLAFIKVAS